MSKPAWSVGARQGDLRRHKKLVWFACEGLIALYDERTPEIEDYYIMQPSELEERAHALGQYAAEIGAGDAPWMREEGRLCKRAAQDMLESVKEARHMGDPSDPAVQAFWSKHRRISTVGGHNFDATNPPELKQMRGPDTGRTVQHDQTISAEEMDRVKIRRMPKKKPRKGGLILTNDLL